MSTVSGSRAPHTHAPSVQNLPVVWKTGSSCPESSGSAPGHPSPVGRPISAPARRSRCFGASITTTLGRSYPRTRRHSRANDGLAAADQPPPRDVPWPQPGAHFELVGLQGRVHTTMLGACRLVGIARSGCPTHTALLVRADGAAPTPFVLGTCHYALRLPPSGQGPLGQRRPPPPDDSPFLVCTASAHSAPPASTSTSLLAAGAPLSSCCSLLPSWVPVCLLLSPECCWAFGRGEAGRM